MDELDNTEIKKITCSIGSPALLSFIASLVLLCGILALAGGAAIAITSSSFTISTLIFVAAFLQCLAIYALFKGIADTIKLQKLTVSVLLNQRDCKPEAMED